MKTESGHEVDFHARMADGTERLLQVSADIDDPSTFERELRALIESAEAFPHATLHLITLTRPAGRTDIPDGSSGISSNPATGSANDWRKWEW